MLWLELSIQEACDHCCDTADVKLQLQMHSPRDTHSLSTAHLESVKLFSKQGLAWSHTMNRMGGTSPPQLGLLKNTGCEFKAMLECGPLLP